jgi:hypothetical protein
MAEQTNLVCLKEGTKKAIDKTFFLLFRTLKMSSAIVLNVNLKKIYLKS